MEDSGHSDHSEHSENAETQSNETLIMDSASDNGSRKRVLIPIVAILGIIVVALLTIKGKVSSKNTSNIGLQPVELAEGAELPDFTLTRIDGTKAMVSELPHKVMMLNFWATWCEACMEEMPSIVKLREAYSSRGLEVLGLNVDEDPVKAAPPIAQKFAMRFPIFMDPTNMLTELFDVHAIPLTVIFDKNRKILMIESGSREWDNEEMHQLVEKWLGPS